MRLCATSVQCNIGVEPEPKDIVQSFCLDGRDRRIWTTGMKDPPGPAAQSRTGES